MSSPRCAPPVIEAIFWDFGGVLTTSPFEAFNRFEASHGIPENFIRGINATNPETNAWARFESSQITLDEFDERFALSRAHRGIASTVSRWLRCWLES